MLYTNNPHRRYSYPCMICSQKTLHFNNYMWLHWLISLRTKYWDPLLSYPWTQNVMISSMPKCPRFVSRTHWPQKMQQHNAIYPNPSVKTPNWEKFSPFHRMLKCLVRHLKQVPWISNCFNLHNKNVYTYLSLLFPIFLTISLSLSPSLSVHSLCSSLSLPVSLHPSTSFLISPSLPPSPFCLLSLSVSIQPSPPPVGLTFIKMARDITPDL